MVVVAEPVWLKLGLRTVQGRQHKYKRTFSDIVAVYRSPVPSLTSATYCPYYCPATADYDYDCLDFVRQRQCSKEKSKNLAQVAIHFHFDGCGMAEENKLQTRDRHQDWLEFPCIGTTSQWKTKQQQQKHNGKESQSRSPCSVSEFS